VPEQLEPDLTEVLLPASPGDRERRRRAIDEAWEAVVREELQRIRRIHARERRDSRFTRRDERS
jgi:hypothetical protein